MTSLLLKNENGQYTVTVDASEIDISHLMIDLVGPLLLAAGYHPENIKRYTEPDYMPEDNNRTSYPQEATKV